MKFHLEQSEGINIIQSYQSDELVINEKRYDSSLVVSPEIITEGWPVCSVERLNEEHLTRVVEHRPEIVLLGTGEVFETVDPRWLVWFGQQGIGLEVMDSGAAARTYNILAGEQRSVAAAIIFRS